MPNLLEHLIAGDEPLAIIRRGPGVEVMTGEVTDVPTTLDIPLTDRPTLAAVPFRQVRERGFEAFDDGAPLRVLQVARRETIDVAEALAVLPQAVPPLTDAQFDIDDAAYARAVRDVQENEIGRGEGANFVLHRSFTGRVGVGQREAVLAFLAALLTGEHGAYWTYAVHLGDLALVGASPERHLSIVDSVVTMNPISGTYRHPTGGPTTAGMLRFLTDAKEVEELFMVVDEELKLMATVCPGGGRVLGPYLKPMSQVTHTEYLLEGRSDFDPREVLRETMFAPTVTGAPMANACRVIKRLERRGRGHYAGVLALFEPTGVGHDLDAPILIRTAYVTPDGEVRVPVGATLVRHSDPAAEVAETATKAAGLLSAIGVRAGDRGASGVVRVGSGGGAADATEWTASAVLDRAGEPGGTDGGLDRAGEPGGGAGLRSGDAGHPGDVGRPGWSGDARDGVGQPGGADDPPRTGGRGRSGRLRDDGPADSLVASDSRVVRTLNYRNERLSPFWLRPQNDSPRPLAGLTATVVDAEDGFSQMLAHQLRRLGASVEVVGWERASADDPGDILIGGSGPGDPAGTGPRIARLHELIAGRLAAKAPLMCVCLSHQIMCRLLGLELRALTRPRQGEQSTDRIFGTTATLGYYNTFTAVAPLNPLPDVEVVRRRGTDEVIALRGPGFVTLQGHPESALSTNGTELLANLVPWLAPRSGQ